MKKYWYILYTRPGTEKKIAAALAKKKIEYYLPLSFRQRSLFTHRPVKEPLFPGYVFVRVPASDLIDIQNAAGALSHVYWKSEPVVVPGKDIQKIKEFTEIHEYVQVLPAKVLPDKEAVRDPSLIVDETSIATLKTAQKIIISSIGFTLMATEQDKYENTKILLVPETQKILN